MACSIMESKFFASPLPTGKALWYHFAGQNVGSDGCLDDSSALLRGKNTRICTTISIFVPSGKGYFSLDSEGLGKAGIVQALELSGSGRF